MAIYYISPSGVDGNAGTISSPRFTIQAGLALCSAGDTLYCRGGTYQFLTQQNIISKNGSSGNLINIWAYPGETPIFTRSASYIPAIGVATDLLYFETCSYLYFKNLDISNYSQHPTLDYWFAFRGNDLSNCKFENINYHHNGSAFTLRGDSTTGNLFLNCDFHHNQDPYSDTPYDGADGLNITYVNNTAAVNTVRNCRAWWNADDGFDLWENEGYVEFDNCWSFYNGYIPDTFSTAGNGSGFKLGRGDTVTTTVRRYVHNCLAFKNRSWGFVENDNPCNMTIVNNTAVQNGGVSGTGGGLNFWFGAWTAQPKTFRNNISYDSGTLFGDVWHAFGADYVHSNNSWDSAVTLTYADFLSTDDSVLDNPRFPDGSLPETVFLKLANGSDLKNAGTNVGLPYSGANPDMGYVESTGNTYFLATTGNDGNSGTISLPWKTIEFASSQLNPADILYIRGGTHRSSKANTIVNRFYINGMNGTSGNIITISNYPGETVVFNCDDVYVAGTAGDGPVGFKIENSSWFRLKGIRITGLAQNPANINSPCGFIVYDSDDWTIEQLEIDNIQGYGFYVQGTKNPGGIGCHRGLVLNCDVHDVGDVYSGWGGANGFQCTGADLSTDITFRGCRAWRCSDDGFDLYSVDGVFRYENCWAFWNGYQPNVAPLTMAGDGMGFKLGPNDSDMTGSITKILHNCLSFENRRFGFDQNVSGAPTTQFQVYNCTAYDNKGGNNYFFGGNTSVNQTFKNNISYVGGVNGSEITSGPNVSNNTWNGGVTVTAGDFVSLNSTGVDGPRQSDGSLPVLNFLKLVSTSDLIDAGTNVGLPYNGSAPDIGAFEFGIGSDAPVNSAPIASAGTNQTITLPTNSVSLTGSGTDTDGTIVSYAWTQISGTTATITSPSSQNTTITGLTTAGTRVFRLTVTDNNGATGTDDINVVVQSAIVTPTISSVGAKFLQMMGIIAHSKSAVISSDINIVFQNFTNTTNTANTYSSTNGVDAFCAYSSNYLPTGLNTYYYANYVDVDSEHSFLSLSEGILNICETTFDAKYAVGVNTATGFYRTMSIADGFIDSAITPVAGDKFGIFISSAGTVTARYFRSGVWTIFYTFTVTNSANLYLSFTGILGNTKISIPKASSNLVTSSGLTNVTFTTLTNLQQSPSGSWIPVDNNLDAGGRASIVLSGDGTFQAEFQSAQNTDSFAINLDVSNSLAMPYWGTARYVLFPKFGNYWFNDNQGGAIDSGIPHVNGDLFRITRTTGVLKAQYFRGGSWTDIATFTGTNTNPLYFYIASAQDGTALKLLNPKQTGAV